MCLTNRKLRTKKLSADKFLVFPCLSWYAASSVIGFAFFFYRLCFRFQICLTGGKTAKTEIMDVLALHCMNKVIRAYHLAKRTFVYQLLKFSPNIRFYKRARHYRTACGLMGILIVLLVVRHCCDVAIHCMLSRYCVCYGKTEKGKTCDFSGK